MIRRSDQYIWSETKFENNLNKKLSEAISIYESFETAFIEMLNKHAPSRKKFLRANHAPYIKKGKKERKKYYESLDMKNVFNSKEFWETMRPFLSDKSTVFSQINIEKNNRIISDDFDLSE